MNYKQIYAKKKACEKRITDAFGNVPNTSGLYVFLRIDENGIKYAYVGQAKHLLSRVAEHLLGYQHIDLSIKKHGLAYYGEKNQHGYRLLWIEAPENELDTQERRYISILAEMGYQLRNKTIGGQNKGKDGLDDNRPSKGYHDGLEQGRKNAINEIKVLFEKYLDYSIKGEPNKIKERKLKELEEILTK